MPELLLELFSEEIPARMQSAACETLTRDVTKHLSDAGFDDLAMRSFATPRRVTLVVDGLAVAQEDRKEERKGPRVGAPDKALEGFLKSVGLTKDQLQTQSDKKGEFYVAVTEQKGRPTADVIADIMPQIIREFHWPKSMRWGAGSLRWVRPLHSILCVFDGAVVPFDVDGITSGNTTQGHRFMGPRQFEVSNFADYEARLRDAHVMLDADDRAQIILTEAKKLANADGFELMEDAGLLKETAGLVEWPVVLMGKIDETFVKPIADGGLPPEVLTTAMAKHQKYFSVRDPKSKGLAPRFVVVSNLIAEDGGAQVIAGNERVLRARLSDAKFFWDQDRKVKLEDRVDALGDIIFHAKLGTVLDKVKRLTLLSGYLAEAIDTDKNLAWQAALLAKADLTTEMVGEFADLQGLMGQYYAEADGEPKEVFAAIKEHYSPLGPSDTCPSEKVSVAVALADKLDTLVGFWAIDEKPTGSKDPYALRRAALGVIRLILENGLRVNLLDLFQSSSGFMASIVPSSGSDERGQSLLSFFADRLKVYLKDKGAKHDVIDAVFALPGQDDLLLVVDRVYALQNFLQEEDGANLLTAYTRAANILRIEEKKDGQSYRGQPDANLLQAPEEIALHEAIDTVVANANVLIQNEDFIAAMAALARLRAPVDAFFDQVTVNAEETDLRRNRLLLLSEIVQTLDTVADFSKLEG